ncbi:MAG: Membrane protein insertase YidC [Acidobacteriota bacterium]|nr:Membrane protein insertase YidC [Acidobacteriota bacterium]
MDTKRLIFAVALSIIVIMVYQYFFMPKTPQVSQPQPGQTVESPDQASKDPGTPGQTQTTGAESGSSTRDLSELFSKDTKKEVVEDKKLEPVKEDIKESQVKEVTVETDLFIAVFTNQGAGLKSLILKKYRDDKKQPLDLVPEKVAKFGVYPFYFSPFGDDKIYAELNTQKFALEGIENINIKLTGGQAKEIVFKYQDVAGNISVFKKFVIYNNSYIMGLDYGLTRDGKVLDAPFVFGPEVENNVSNQRSMQMDLKIRAYDGNDTKDIEFSKVKTELSKDKTIEKGEGTLGGNFLWAAFERAYFAVVFQTSRKDSSIRYSVVKETPAPVIAPTAELQGKEKQAAAKSVPELYSYMIVTNPGSVYMGPKDEDVLDMVKTSFPDVDIIIEYGWLDTIAKILLKGINLVHKFVPNYGWAIVVFTVLLKIILFPLTYTSSVSMAKMQTLQPKLKALKKKYSNMRDPEERRKMNLETMELYKREKVNPASGCLPLLLQLPILFGFFNLLRTCINVRHEPWILWVTDLSLKDPYYILPILMGITQVIIQKMTPSTADGIQQKMMYLMPVVITFFVLNLPSGLTLYWFASNILQIGQQYIINKKIFQEKKDEDKMRKILKRKKGVKSL